MKRFLSFACAALCCMVMNAQLVTSRSVSTIETPKPVVQKESKTTWMFKVGMATNNFVGDGMDDDASAKVGYTFGFEFNRKIRQKGAYWGMDFLFGSRGFKYSASEDNWEFVQKLKAHNFQWSPFTFGWKIDLTDKIAIDPHVGFFMSVDYAGKETYSYGYDGDKEKEEIGIYDEEFGDYMPLDLGMKFGVGVWFNKKFNLDLTYQRGFVDPFDYQDDDYTVATSNFLIRLGYAF